MLEVRAALLARTAAPGARPFTSCGAKPSRVRGRGVGYERDMAHEAFAVWHAARNQVEPFAEVIPALEKLKARFRLATLSNGNADLARDRPRAPF